MEIEHWPDRIDQCSTRFARVDPARFTITDVERYRIKARAAAALYSALAVFWAALYVLFAGIVAFGGSDIYLLIYGSYPFFILYCYEARAHIERARELQTWCDFECPTSG